MRNNFLLLFLTLIFLISCTRKSGPNSKLSNTYHGIEQNNTKSDVDYYVAVVKVVDGDTFDGQTQDNIEIRFRLQGIDAPERKQDFSSKSKDKLSELIFGKSVGIKVHKKRDGYGRPIVYVTTDEYNDVGAEMLRSGLAWHAKKYDDSDLYNELERAARRNRKGLWSTDNPMPPWEYRK